MEWPYQKAILAMERQPVVLDVSEYFVRHKLQLYEDDIPPGLWEARVFSSLNSLFRGVSPAGVILPL